LRFSLIPLVKKGFQKEGKKRKKMEDSTKKGRMGLEKRLLAKTRKKQQWRDRGENLYIHQKVVVIGEDGRGENEGTGEKRKQRKLGILKGHPVQKTSRDGCDLY